MTSERRLFAAWVSGGSSRRCCSRLLRWFLKQLPDEEIDATRCEIPYWLFYYVNHLLVSSSWGSPSECPACFPHGPMPYLPFDLNMAPAIWCNVARCCKRGSTLHARHYVTRQWRWHFGHGHICIRMTDPGGPAGMSTFPVQRQIWVLQASVNDFKVWSEMDGNSSNVFSQLLVDKIQFSLQTTSKIVLSDVDINSQRLNRTSHWPFEAFVKLCSRDVVLIFMRLCTFGA